MTALGAQTVTVRSLQTTGRDAFGVKTQASVDTDVAGCSFQSLMSTELDSNRIADQRWLCIAPADSAVAGMQSTDEINVDGVEYRLDGPVLPRIDLDGRMNHVSAVCVRWDG